MKIEEQNISDAIIIVVVSALALLLFTNCTSIKLQHQTFDPSGNVLTDTGVSYYRLFNQSIEGLDIINPLFTAKLKDQEANNDEAIESVGKATGNVVGSAVGAFVK